MTSPPMTSPSELHPSPTETNGAPPQPAARPPRSPPAAARAARGLRSSASAPPAAAAGARRERRAARPTRHAVRGGEVFWGKGRGLWLEIDMCMYII